MNEAKRQAAYLRYLGYTEDAKRLLDVPNEIHVPTAEDVAEFAQIDSLPNCPVAPYPYSNGRRYESKGEH